ncbi:MAG: hypothetical protein R3C71_07630 [Candidatus Krumholzibacteriia bacterium]|nr:hypothetical protein [bacterium]MCB9514021.1 hypothetical protein [Candidatus Latescibacterota bacterium]MCB9515751.1 hypothetical protein [Candidatus Latescibacterota bacterium]
MSRVAIRPAVLRWLLDGDPAIRWQVMRDLADEPARAVAAERARVASEGWGATLLARQNPDGSWGDPGSPRRWEPTLFTMLLLREFGLDPDSSPARAAAKRLGERFTWGPEFGDSPFFEGEVEPCINGHTLALGAYFGVPSERLMKRLLSEQLDDGGWNCEAERGSVRSSFHTTLCVLEGLLAYEHARGATPALTKARRLGEEYLLRRDLMRRLSTGRVIDQQWTRFAFPTTWHYDVLRGLDYFRRAGGAPDKRLGEAVEVVRTRRHQNERWPLGTVHADPVDLAMEAGKGHASRWITLRALRVLDWFASTGGRA